MEILKKHFSNANKIRLFLEKTKHWQHFQTAYFNCCALNCQHCVALYATPFSNKEETKKQTKKQTRKKICKKHLIS